MAGNGGYFFLLFDFFLPLPITFFMALPTAFSIDFSIDFFFFLAIADSPNCGLPALSRHRQANTRKGHEKAWRGESLISLDEPAVRL